MKMFQINIFVFTLYVASSIGIPLNGQPSKFDSKADIQITKFHVDTSIQMRYAVTKVTSQMKNHYSETQMVFFNMFIPKDAFVSNFSMTIKEKIYVANVETKEKAKIIFENSNSNAGQNHKQSDFKETEHIAFSAKADSYDEVVFEVTYEQPLERVMGLNNYKLHLNLKDQIIDDFKIKVNITETLPIRRENFEVRRESNEFHLIKKTADLVDTISFGDEKTAPNTVVVQYVPAIDKQNNGEDWQFNVYYDVIRPKDGNDVQIGAGHFVHYFSPEDFPNLIKHVIFVIDISGSMEGSKIKQTKDALLGIIDHLDSNDSFDVITFNDTVHLWYPIASSSCSMFERWRRLTKKCLKSEAEKMILHLDAGGSADINAALSMAIKFAKSISCDQCYGESLEIYKDVKQTMIIFFTNGRPSSGITNNEVIKSNIRKFNKDQVPIYGLAFGDNADFDLIKDISTESGGFTERIYESGNSFEQLVNYYKEISDPKLRNVNFQYIANGKKIPAKLVIGAEIGNTYGKNEYVITGEFEDPEIKLEHFEIVTIGEDANGIYTRILSILDPQLPVPDNPCFLDPQLPVPDNTNPPTSSKWEKTPSESFMERLWAFKKIKFLLKNDEQCKKGKLESCSACNNTVGMDCSKQALNLAIRYNFVTKATSLVVESDDDYVKNGPINFDAESILVRNLAYFCYKKPICKKNHMTWPTKKYPDINPFYGNGKSIGNNHLTKLGPSNYPANNQNYPTNNLNIHTNIKISPDQGSYPRNNWIYSSSSKFTVSTLLIMTFSVLIQYNIYLTI